MEPAPPRPCPGRCSGASPRLLRLSFPRRWGQTPAWTPTPGKWESRPPAPRMPGPRPAPHQTAQAPLLGRHPKFKAAKGGGLRC